MNRRRDLGETAVHLSLTRPVLLFGAEADVVVAEMVIAALYLAFLGPKLITFAVIGLLFAVAHPVAVAAAQKDSVLLKIYLRHLAYRAYYPAASRFDAPLRKVATTR